MTSKHDTWPLKDDQPKREASLAAPTLLACPFCGGQPAITEMRYVNTGRLYGYRLECGGCGLKRQAQPVCWPTGKENESLLEAKEALETWWNARQANE